MFNQELKANTLPSKKIGVITSPWCCNRYTSQVKRSFPVSCFLWPVAVQGEGSAEKISHAIDKFNQLTGKTNIKKPDLIIIAGVAGV